MTSFSQKFLARKTVAELIGQYDVPQLKRILTQETPAFTGLAVAYTPARHPGKLYRITYLSVIPERGNRPTPASDLIAIPKTADKALPEVSYQHGTVFSKQAVPSFPEESPETRLMIAQFAGQGYGVIGAPDYFGMGTSTEKEGIRMKELCGTGWSQGGVVSMAFLEKLESAGIAVRVAATASAQCDALVMLHGLLSFPRKIDAPWVSTMFILSAFSLEEYHGIPGLARALFTAEQYEITRKIHAKEPVDEKDFPGDLRKLIRSEYLDPQKFRGIRLRAAGGNRTSLPLGRARAGPDVLWRSGRVPLRRTRAAADGLSAKHRQHPGRGGIRRGGGQPSRDHRPCRRRVEGVVRASAEGGHDPLRFAGFPTRSLAGTVVFERGWGGDLCSCKFCINPHVFDRLPLVRLAVRE